MYAKLFEKLLSGGVEFLILGGAAVSLHGFARMTTDIDIILNNTPENISRFVSVVGQWGEGAASGLIFTDFQGPGCVRIVEDFPLDVFTVLDGKAYDHFVPSAKEYRLSENLEIRCLSIDDLIALKKGTLREKDQLDVTALRRLQSGQSPNEVPTINLGPPED